jgi:RNA ligase
LYRECRGIIFHKETGKIISRRFHKFFNLNELDETHEDLVDVGRPHVLLDKMDGCLVSPFVSLGKLRWGSKMGITEVRIPYKWSLHPYFL